MRGLAFLLSMGLQWTQKVTRSGGGALTRHTDLPGHETHDDFRLHSWCQWISCYHPAGVYDGEKGKQADYHPAQERAIRRAGRVTAQHYLWPQLLSGILLPRLRLLAALAPHEITLEHGESRA